MERTLLRYQCCLSTNGLDQNACDIVAVVARVVVVLVVEAVGGSSSVRPPEGVVVEVEVVEVLR